MGRVDEDMAQRRACLLAFIFAFATAFVFPVSNKLLNKKAFSETGTIFIDANGEYTLITGKSRSRKTVHIIAKEGYEDVYASLLDYVGQNVRIEGIEVSRKSLWNITIELTSLALAD